MAARVEVQAAACLAQRLGHRQEAEADCVQAAPVASDLKRSQASVCFSLPMLTRRQADNPKGSATVQTSANTQLLAALPGGLILLQGCLRAHSDMYSNRMRRIGDGTEHVLFHERSASSQGKAGLVMFEP